MLASGWDLSHVKWVPHDGIGRSARNGVNFTERCFGVRGAVGGSGRDLAAASQMLPEDADWDSLFARGVRWFHTGGIFAALSAESAGVADAAMRAARAREVKRSLAKYLDVVIGNEEDFTACLGLEVAGVDQNLTDLGAATFQAMIGRAAAECPNFQVIATTLRGVVTASRNDWGAVAWSRQQGFAAATPRKALEILDRVGGGDSFASGLAYGLTELGSITEAVEYGAAHGALAMTTPGDTSMATLAEVRKLVQGGGARVQR